MESSTSSNEVVKITDWQIYNIKGHFLIDFDLKKCVCQNRKKKNYKYNFCVVNLDGDVDDDEETNKVTYIIFKNYVNITGVKSIARLHEARTKLLKHFHLERSGAGHLSVDNIFISGKFNLPFISLCQFESFAKSQNLDVEYSNLRFPALYLKNYKALCTVSLFGSGKFNLLGLKCMPTTDYILQVLPALMNLYMMTI